MCNCVWITNGGKGGAPVYKKNRQMSSEPITNVKCAKCNARTWFTGAQFKDANNKGAIADG